MMILCVISGGCIENRVFWIEDYGERAHNLLAQGLGPFGSDEIYFRARRARSAAQKGGPDFRSPTRVILTACNFLRPQAD
jgi:hypothetical protein